MSARWATAPNSCPIPSRKGTKAALSRSSRRQKAPKSLPGRTDRLPATDGAVQGIPSTAAYMPPGKASCRPLSFEYWTRGPGLDAEPSRDAKLLGVTEVAANSPRQSSDRTFFRPRLDERPFEIPWIREDERLRDWATRGLR